MSKHSSNFKNITGQTFGRLTAIALAPKKNKVRSANWFCRCACGNTTTVLGIFLRYGHIRSCGCLNVVQRIHGQASKGKETKAYKAWSSMRERCLQPSHPAWKWYGGRGITICDRWNEFKRFYEDMGDPAPGMSLDRIDNDKGYGPENCRWATWHEQARNRSNNKILTWNNKTKSVTEWAIETGINRTILFRRLNEGWSVERTLTQKPRKSPTKQF